MTAKSRIVLSKTEARSPLSSFEVSILKARLSIAQPARAEHWDLLIDMKLQTNARPNELLGALWEEFDEAKKIWHLPASRGKCGARDIDLSAKAIKTLRRLRSLAKPGDDRVFACFESVVSVGRAYSAQALKAGLGRRFFHGLRGPKPLGPTPSTLRLVSQAAAYLGRSPA
ncbi:hypothetical protein [Massilia sp. TWP1-3-3]|uniref:hypothetical protein n=1 Tax=Massilia sp. TWP1-3-3 TaxID=2804573 RepID=UPI003CED6E08